MVLANSTPLPVEPVERYADSGSVPVTVDRDAFAAAGVELVERDLLAAGDLVRHDPDKLARAALALIGGRREPTVAAAAAGGGEVR